MPIYRGADFLPHTLRSIQAQTHRGLRVLMSVDGDDRASYDVCRQFTDDPRFEVVLQREQLGWPGNFNWLVERCDLPFLVYWQQDDFASTRYIEILRAALLADPTASVAFTDVQWVGEEIRRDTTPSIAGPPLARVLQQFESVNYLPLRGLVRASMLPPDPVIPDAPDVGSQQEFVYLARLAAAGGFTRVDGALYYKTAHPDSVSSTARGWPEHWRQREWARLGARVFGVALPLAEEGEDGRLLATFLDRLTIYRPGRGYFHETQPSVHALREFALLMADEGGIDLGDERWAVGQTSGLERPIHPHVIAALDAERARAQRLRAGEGLFEDMLGWGWNEREDWGVWSSGETASLELGVWPGGTLRLEGQVYAPAGPVRIGWSLDGGEPDWRSFATNGQSVELDFAVPAGARRVHLHLPDAVSPVEAGLSTDPRRISLGLRTCTRL